MADYLDTWSQKRATGTITEAEKQLLVPTPWEVFQKLIGSLDPVSLARGIDISHWNGAVDIAKMKTEGDIAFVWAKSSDGQQVRDGSATDPKNFVDDRFRENVQKCYDAGIPCGGYHYVQPYFYGYNNKGAADWNWTCMQAAFDGLVPKKSYHMICLDVEEKTTTDYNGSDIVLDLMARIAAHPKMSQVPLFIYSSNSVLNYYSKLRDQISYQGANKNLWMAQWVITGSITTTWANLISAYLPKINMKVLTPGYANWRMLQFSAAFILPGCNGACDLNLYNGTKAALYNWLGYAATTPPEPPVDPGDPPTAGEVSRAEFDALKAAFENHTHGKPVA